MAIIEATQPLPPRQPIVLLYGEPGVGKTSLLNTCELPLNIDFDRGADRATGRKDTLVAKGWAEVMADEATGAFAKYKTIGIDTAKAALDDFIMEYVCELDMALARNKLRAFGEVGDIFKAFINRRRKQEAAILIIAHSKKDEDTKRMLPAVSGQSYELLQRIADQIGYISIKNGRRVITWEPTDTTVGKNTARLPETVLPPTEDPTWKNFGRNLIDTVAKKLREMDEAQVAALAVMKDYQERIAAIANEDLVLSVLEILKQMEPEHEWVKAQLRQAIGQRFFDNIAAVTTPEDLTKQIAIVNELPQYLSIGLKSVIVGKGKKMGWKYNETAKIYEAAPGTAPQPNNTTPIVAATEPAPVDAKVETSPAPANEVVKATEPPETETVAPTIWNTSYGTAAEVLNALDGAIVSTNVSDLYFANHQMVDGNADVNKAFAAKQVEIRNKDAATKRAAKAAGGKNA